MRAVFICIYVLWYVRPSPARRFIHSILRPHAMFSAVKSAWSKQLRHCALIPSGARFLLKSPLSLCGFSRLFFIYALLYQSFPGYLPSPAHFLIRFPCTGYPSMATLPLAFLNSIYLCVSNFALNLKLSSPLSSLLPLSHSLRESLEMICIHCELFSDNCTTS